MSKNNQKTFTIYAKEVKLEKTKFISCSAEINGKWYKIKFTQDCEGTPKTLGVYDLTIDLKDCSIQKGKRYISATGNEGVENSTIWVKSIVKLRKYTEEELAERSLIELNAVFDDENDEDLN